MALQHMPSDQGQFCFWSALDPNGSQICRRPGASRQEIVPCAEALLCIQAPRDCKAASKGLPRTQRRHVHCCMARARCSMQAPPCLQRCCPACEGRPEMLLGRGSERARGLTMTRLYAAVDADSVESTNACCCAR